MADRDPAGAVGSLRPSASTRTAILGAGVSGLCLGLLLDGELSVFESTDRAGGHCGSTIADGWTYDHGPHIMFSRDAEVLDFMVRSLAGNVHRSRRNNRISVAGSLCRYPIENDLAALPDELRNRCLLDFLFNPDADLAREPANLKEWFLGGFGPALTELYFEPYNEKVWNVPLAELSMSWSERIPQPPAEDVVKGALGISTEGYLHQLYYHYPRRGGYEALPRAWAELLEPGVLALSTPVESISFGPDGPVLRSRRGDERFDRVVSTVPIAELLRLMGDVPERVRSAAESLQVNPMAVVTLGLHGDDPNLFTAVYFADREYLPNRISLPCTFSPDNGPPGHYSIQAEITAHRGSAVLQRSDTALIDHVVEGLAVYGLIARDEEPVFTDVQRFENAYVVYTVGYEEQLELVRSWAESRGVYLHGRFGAFEYLNVDGCVMRSRELATRLNCRDTGLEEIILPAGTA